MAEADKLRIPLPEIVNLSQLFYLRVKRTPDITAYHYFNSETQSWTDLSWAEMAGNVARWQAALLRENLSPGDRVALMLSNSPTWVTFEQAALGLGLIVVPLYTNDRVENVSYIIEDAQIRILLVESATMCQDLVACTRKQDSLQRIICLEPVDSGDEIRILPVATWLPEASQRYVLQELRVHKSSLATIVYTSGTTGKPKGVMLSHENIFWNASAGLSNIKVYDTDTFLSFLPLSHMLERTAGYYLPMICGCTVTYARSIDKLAEDLVLKKPTILISVPRVFERVYNRISIQLDKKSVVARHLFKTTVTVGWHRFRYQQGKQAWHPRLLLWPILHFLVARKILARLGGHLRAVISGGAPLPFNIARTFIGLGLTIAQGYGLTESSPVISVNKLEDNEPDSVGQPLAGIEFKLGSDDELMVRAPCVMMGYWNQDDATRAVITPDGWLHTGDKVRIERGHIYITGRLKEILVLSNGEKVPPADMEMAICNDPLFDQAMVIGEQKPYLSALLVLNQEGWEQLSEALGITSEKDMLNHPTVHNHVIKRVQELLSDFPGYAKIHQVYLTLEPWTIENDLLTPTLKQKRRNIIESFNEQISQMYHGH